MKAPAPVSRRLRVVGEFLYGARWVFAAYFASRLLIFAVILMSRLILVRAESWHPGGLLSVLGQWDGDLWYLEIARNGYSFSTVRPSPMPFFPFFPMLVKLVSFVFHDMRIAAFIVSHVSLLAAGLLLHALVSAEYKDPRVSRVAVTLLMFNPAAFFLSHAYTESTFLMLATGSFFCAITGQWLLACVLGMCLSATRNVGILIALPLFLEYLRQFRARPFAGLLHPRVLLLGLVPLGLGGYMWFSYVKFNDPLAFVHASAVWGRSFTSPAQTFASLGRFQPFLRPLFLITMGTAMLLWVAGFYFEIRASYLVFAGMLTATYWCASSMEAWPRFLSVEFPLYIVVGLIATRFKSAYEPILAASITLLAISTVLSATGFWIT
ncbi:MAG TPA: mannosyltransferase family protein [Chthoniobacterales bacterium]|nr:mannosyltransferase family protein [Chthoniobacterales bacterium]